MKTFDDDDWTEDANEYWEIVVKCLVAFHNFTEVDAQVECTEFRSRLEDPISDDDDNDFKWLYMHEEPFQMANSVSGYEIVVGDDISIKEYEKKYLNDICGYYNG